MCRGCSPRVCPQRSPVWPHAKQPFCAAFQSVGYQKEVGRHCFKVFMKCTIARCIGRCSSAVGLFQKPLLPSYLGVLGWQPDGSSEKAKTGMQLPANQMLTAWLSGVPVVCLHLF